MISSGGTCRRRVAPGRTGLVLALVTLGAAAVAAHADGVARADYDRLLESRFSTPSFSVQAAGTSWKQDVGEWSLVRGEVRLQEAVGNGLIPGMTFSGSGRFSMEVPDQVEREQLARVSGRSVADVFDVAFTDLVLSTSGDLLSELFPDQAPSRFELEPLVVRRRKVEFEKLRHDVSARVLAGLLTPGDQYLRVDMNTEEFGWLTFEYDHLRSEEIELTILRQNWFTEVWVSLDRAADRDASGRPSGDRHAQIDLEHVDLTIDLTGKRRSVRVGVSGVNLLEVGCVADLTFIPHEDRALALPLHLSPTAKVSTVRNEAGEELDFIRDHLGARTADLEKDVYDSSLVVLLNRPLERGERRTLTVEYMKLMANYAAGRGWYPNLPDNTNDRHTAAMEVKLDPRQEVRATGRLIEESSGGGVKRSVWAVDHPSKAVSFTYGRDFREETLAAEGVPDVISFGPKVSKGFGGNMIRNVGEDVLSSLSFFQGLLDSSLDLDRIQLTGIAAGHGQAFRGFIHMGELTFASERPGATELFRAHEAAHQWWGHEIGWKSYRDQWLSEALAEYMGMMFVQRNVKNGGKHFTQMLKTSTQMLLGSIKGQFSKYGRPWSMHLDLSERRRLGPIAVGYRAATAEIPSGYFVQTYTKGALVMHSLNSILSALDSDDELFVEVLREFAREFRGKDASTRDFIETVNRVVPGDWTWFFDQWLYGTAIPTYRWDARLPRSAGSHGEWIVELRVEQDDVPDGYRMMVPVAIEFGKERRDTYLAQISKPAETFLIALPEEPTKVVFNPDFAVLARVKRK